MRYILTIVLLVSISCNTKHDAKVNYQDELPLPDDTANMPLTSSFTPAGKYKVVSLYGGSEPCDLGLEITANKNKFSYLFFSKDDHKGEAIVQFDSISPPLIKFEGFMIEKSIEPDVPQTLGGEWKGDTIIIQNYGNVMNEFNVFECEEKYIYLVRQK